MRNLLSIFIFLTLVITSTVKSLVACKGEASQQGNLVSAFVYNGEQKFKYVPVINNKIKNGIDDITKNGIDEMGFSYEYFLKNGQTSLVNSIINPLLHGINLTKYNSISNRKGAKWTNEQILCSLQLQKNKLISIAKTNIKDPLDNSKKINQKKIWNDFFNNYSTSYDSYYTQAALIANENSKILTSEKNLIDVTGNIENINNKELVKKDYYWNNNKKGTYLLSSLKVLCPVASIIKWLNDPNNNFNKGYNQIYKNRGYQSARYAAIIIPDVTIRFGFRGEYNNFTFTVTIDKIVAYANYLVYKNPNSSNGKTTYGHQWFFVNYSFYDFNILNDSYHSYNLNNIPDNIKINPNIIIVLGIIKKNIPIGILTSKEDDKTIKNEQFFIKKSDYTFPILKWKINVNSITYKY